jgi:mannitol-1-phosphate 5-dehydrogenase
LLFHSFGGGNIGRGFIAELLHESGFKVVFVDVVDDLINRINDSKSYKITEVGEDGEKTKTISNYTAVSTDLVRSVPKAPLMELHEL